MSRAAGQRARSVLLRVCPPPAPSLSFSVPCSVHSFLGLPAYSLARSVSRSVALRSLALPGSWSGRARQEGDTAGAGMCCGPDPSVPPLLRLPASSSFSASTIPRAPAHIIAPTGAPTIVSVLAVDSQANVSVPPWHASSCVLPCCLSGSCPTSTDHAAQRTTSRPARPGTAQGGAHTPAMQPAAPS